MKGFNMSVSKCFFLILGFFFSMTLSACDLFNSKNQPVIEIPQPKKEETSVFIRFKQNNGDNLTVPIRVMNHSDVAAAELVDSTTLELKKDLLEEKVYFSVDLGGNSELLMFSIVKDSNCAEGFSLTRYSGASTAGRTACGPAGSLYVDLYYPEILGGVAYVF